MPFEAVSFTEVTTEGLESSPVAEALASLRANEARYFSNKYKHTFTVTPAAEAQDVLRWVEEILESGREIVPTSPALEVSINDVDGVYWVEAANDPLTGGRSRTQLIGFSPFQVQSLRMYFRVSTTWSVVWHQALASASTSLSG
ncbi:hypothetical protein QYM46_07495 [Brevibacterium sp. K11IcPPYGO002]|uniref:hypothetical protein n=1 Tax=Brevibacterium sp. K11IcPPYGO002 TaxID=3058837 RepID=UPI003D8134C9